MGKRILYTAAIAIFLIAGQANAIEQYNKSGTPGKIEQRKSNSVTAYRCSDNPKKPSSNPACSGNQGQMGGSSGGQYNGPDLFDRLKHLLSR